MVGVRGFLGVEVVRNVFDKCNGEKVESSNSNLNCKVLISWRQAGSESVIVGRWSGSSEMPLLMRWMALGWIGLRWGNGLHGTISFTAGIRT